MLLCSSQLSAGYLKLKTRKSLFKIIKLLLNWKNRKGKKVNQKKFKVLQIYKKFKRNKNWTSIQKRKASDWSKKRAKTSSQSRKKVLRLSILVL